MKITRTTIKNFINKNTNKLFIEIKSSFNGMIDGCDDEKNCSFSPVHKIDTPRGDWTDTFYIDGMPVLRSGGSGNLIDAYEDDKYIGYDIYNCCGSFKLAVEK